MWLPLYLQRELFYDRISAGALLRDADFEGKKRGRGTTMLRQRAADLSVPPHL
jgi:hypothetical protein